MNILFITPYIPSRIRARPFHFIKGLSSRHKVHVIALGEAEKGKIPGGEELMDLAQDIRVAPHSKLQGLAQSLLALPTRSPMCTAFCRSSSMQGLVETVLKGQQFDIIHIEHLRAAHFLPSQGDVPVVFDAVDCLTGLFEQMALNAKSLPGKLLASEEAWKLRRYEPEMIKRFESVMVTSDSEREAFMALDAGLNPLVVGNGVDTEYFSPQGGVRKPHRLVFSGKMSYQPNAEAVLWFAHNVLPAVQQKFADLELVIVGSDPPPEVCKLSGVPGVTVTGYVEDIRPYLDTASVGIAPMQIAAGVQNKVLEAMAMDLPVVASKLAARAFGSGCTGIIEAESPEDMVHQVSALLGSPAETKQIGRLAREEVKKLYSWESSVRNLEYIYQAAIEKHKARS